MKLNYLIILYIFISGCSYLKANPYPTTKFLPKPELVKEQRNRAPFNGYWVYDPVGLDNLKVHKRQIFINDINIDNVKKTISKKNISEIEKIDLIEEAETLATYFKQLLILQFKNKASDKIEIANKKEKTINIYLALVDVVPTNSSVNVVGTVAGFFVPGGSLIKKAGNGSIAIEGYIELEDLELLLLEQLKDREIQKSGVFTVKDYQKYAHIRVIIDDWVGQIIELYLTSYDHQVDDSLIFSIDPL